MSVEKVVDKVAEDGQQREKVYRLLIVVLAGVLVVTWVAVVWLVQAKNSADDDLDKTKESYAAGPDAQAAAERILGKMISFDYREIADEYDWTKYLGDDELRTDYEDNIVPKLAKVIRKTKAAADGEVIQSAYNTVDDTTVVVLAFIRQKLTDLDNKDGVIAEQWASLTMTRGDKNDDWMIDMIDIVSVPPPS